MSDYYAIRDGIQNAYHLAAQHATEQALIIGNEMLRPSVTMRPKVFLDGNSWCALYGENIQSGVCGFGISPAAACEAFDRAWDHPREGERGGGK